jgi:hypothetical protein
MNSTRSPPHIAAEVVALPCLSACREINELARPLLLIFQRLGFANVCDPRTDMLTAFVGEVIYAASDTHCTI